MNAILEIDLDNHVAVVQPGVTLEELDRAAAEHGLVYPVFPGESSASLGGNVATNAGGMRAIKYGVTRHHVLGLEAVLASGEVIRTGGKFVKTSTGYDLTQLIVGSEGTLALVTEATLKLHPRLDARRHRARPFRHPRRGHRRGAPDHRARDRAAHPRVRRHDHHGRHHGQRAASTSASPRRCASGARRTSSSCSRARTTIASTKTWPSLGELLVELGAMDVYVLPPQAAAQLIEAREKAFFVAKAHGADDIVDVVVPRAAIPQLPRGGGVPGRGARRAR